MKRLRKLECLMLLWASGCGAVARCMTVRIASDRSVKAVLVLRPGAALTPMAVKAYCRENLAGYKVPKVVEFALALPRTSSGKLQRFKLELEDGLS